MCERERERERECTHVCVCMYMCVCKGDSGCAFVCMHVTEKRSAWVSEKVCERDSK